MQNQADVARFLFALVGLGAGLCGCADQSPFTGRRIVEDLERSQVPAPNNDWSAVRADPQADLPSSGAITLADLLRTAEARSPSLAAARSDVGVAAGQVWQSSLYPNPRTDVYIEDVSWRDGFSDAKTTVGVAQPIILGNRRQAAVDAASAEQAARQAEVEVQRRTLFGEVSAEYVRLVAIREQELLYTELRDLADRTLAAAKTRFEARAAPETDVIRPRVEVYRIDAALNRLAQEQTASGRRLSQLIGNVDVDPSRIEESVQTIPQSVDADALEALVRATHPALVVADREIEVAAAKLEQVRAERTPDLDVRVAAGYRGESDDGIVEFGAGSAIPLWDNRQGDILSMRFKLMQARQERAAIENDLLAQLAPAVGEYEAARVEFITFHDQIVPDAQRAFDQTGEGYRGGRSTFLDLLDTQRTLTEARVTLAELASDVATARARIIQIVGPDGLGSPGATPAPAPGVSSLIEERPTGAEAQP